VSQRNRSWPGHPMEVEAPGRYRSDARPGPAPVAESTPGWVTDTRPGSIDHLHSCRGTPAMNWRRRLHHHRQFRHGRYPALPGTGMEAPAGEEWSTGKLLLVELERFGQNSLHSSRCSSQQPKPKRSMTPKRRLEVSSSALHFKMIDGAVLERDTVRSISAVEMMNLFDVGLVFGNVLGTS
jgi:hypothetical protein